MPLFKAWLIMFAKILYWWLESIKLFFLFQYFILEETFSIATNFEMKAQIMSTCKKPIQFSDLNIYFQTYKAYHFTMSLPLVLET